MPFLLTVPGTRWKGGFAEMDLPDSLLPYFSVQHLFYFQEPPLDDFREDRCGIRLLSVVCFLPIVETDVTIEPPE